ncbi:MAG: adenylyltransferase/cytidyltransferase family protein [Elusimicrobia bacterium]|nr:adenylyltransferase/cytidyltransferase family protein [Elusimicrobiota bacterium]
MKTKTPAAPKKSASKPAARGKVLSIETLASELELQRSRKKKIVHCHGVFDLLHVGHIRHFTEAKAMGDILVVTLTPDQHVNKGPHRPAFPQDLRAEVIAALDAVDFVAVNKWPTAVNAIKLLKPDVYAKGPDYKDTSKDLTGGITVEEEAVRAAGGEIRFTEDITFSSSKLLNRHMPQFDGPVAGYLERLRQHYSGGDIAGLVDSLRRLKVLVVGEAILDQYVYCNAMGKSSKEPILALQYVSEETHAGGALAVANHLAEFCDRVDLATYLGAKDSKEDFIRSNLKPNVSPFFVRKTDSPTILKRRFVQATQVTKLLEIYEMNDSPLEGREEDEFCGWLDQNLSGYDVVVAADFGHGLIGPRAVELLAEKARFLSVMTQINAANIGYHTISKYPRADYVCIHEGELRLDHRNRRDELKLLIQNQAKRLCASTVMVTRGTKGTLLYCATEGFSECPAFAIKIVDRIGAGDAVLAVTSLGAAAKLPPAVIGFLGNLAGAQAVTIIGNSASISRVSLLKSAEALLK